MEDVKANVALFDTLEPLVNIVLPNGEAIQDGSILVLGKTNK